MLKKINFSLANKLASENITILLLCGESSTDLEDSLFYYNFDKLDSVVKCFASYLYLLFESFDNVILYVDTNDLMSLTVQEYEHYVEHKHGLIDRPITIEDIEGWTDDNTIIFNPCYFPTV